MASEQEVICQIVKSSDEVSRMKILVRVVWIMTMDTLLLMIN